MNELDHGLVLLHTKSTEFQDLHVERPAASSDLGDIVAQLERKRGVRWTGDERSLAMRFWREE